ncbi:MAG: two-component system, chemotaxis family, response regulator CheY [Actinomycetia bacterium]|jgi:two-component system chemotaxis response regulator CheY|nr:two-component system, chemotaxis family, response regulator CheY [Actinomycetes bacterium]
MRAMVVDDSKAMRAVLGRMLRSCGYDEVFEATNGVDAFRAIRDHGSPDVVLVDWNMPEMSGIEFVRRARSSGLIDDASLVMVTSESSIEKVMEALESGADEYLMKPFTQDALLEKIELARSRH